MAGDAAVQESTGDTLVVVPSLDRLGRSVQDLIAIVSGLRKRGVGRLVPWTMSSRMDGR
ncbi:recombinase family protein [Streptomyces decoyicus]|uniref:recombinase family protein n=1 Tax=Streptomyces decoyicus TaxID=249567 RepID=UPI003907FCC6